MVLDSVLSVMNAIFPAAAGMVKRVVLMILPVAVVAVGVRGAVEKGTVVLYKDVTPGIVILMVVKVNLNVRMILPVANVVVGVMEPAERLEDMDKIIS